MLVLAPKLRDDLLTSRQQVSGEVYVVIKDPRTGRFFRLREPEFWIAQQLDGTLDPPALRQRVEEHFGAAPDASQLAQFVTRLERLGLLETGQAASIASTPRRRVQGTLLYLRFPAFDPNRLLDRLSPWVAGCFTPAFVTVSAALILGGFIITALEWDAILRDVGGLWRFDALLLAWVTVLAVTAGHEFAHGLTCKHFGGEVREMGFMLIYFQPAFYCNVSDAWLFPERAKRLWVTFAGAYFEMFFWALATVTWRVVEGGTWVSFVALIVMATSAIKSFFNFNPLIKLDGYYLLSDYLEIPNLRQRAVGYVASRIKRLCGRRVPELASVSTRERRIFLLYGVLAGVYSYWLLGTIALAFGRYLIDQYQGVGAVLFATMVASPFHGRFKRLGARVAAAAGTLAPRPLKPSRMKAVVASLVALGVVSFGRMELSIAGEFRVLPLHNADVRAEVAGLIERIYVDEGSRVKAGELIATLSDKDLRAELEKTEAEIREKQAALKRLMTGARPEEIALAQSEAQTARTALEQLQARARSAEQVRVATLAGARNAVEKAAARLTYAESDLERARSLSQSGLISRQQLDERQVDVDVRRRELEEARAALDALLSDDLAEIRGELAVAERQADAVGARLTLLLAGSRREEIEIAEAALAGLEARRRLLETDLAHTRLVSPTAGIVTTPSLELKDRIGQYVNRGDLVAEVHDLETIIAEIAVAEWETADVQPNQRVRVRARAYPGVEFEGRVSTIAATVTPRDPAVAWNRDRVILVTTALENDALRLKPGMNGYARISGGPRRIIDLLTRRLRGFVRTEFWYW